MPKPKLIVCAAIRLRDRPEVVVYGPRHGHCFKVVANLDFAHRSWEQGFADQDGKFLSREDAWEVADREGQVRCPTGLEENYSKHRPPNVKDQGVLFSENLY